MLCAARARLAVGGINIYISVFFTDCRMGQWIRGLWRRETDPSLWWALACDSGRCRYCWESPGEGSCNELLCVHYIGAAVLCVFIGGDLNFLP